MTRGGWVALMLCGGALTGQAAEPVVTDCDFRLECQRVLADLRLDLGRMPR